MEFNPNFKREYDCHHSLNQMTLDRNTRTVFAVWFLPINLAILSSELSGSRPGVSQI